MSNSITANTLADVVSALTALNQSGKVSFAGIRNYESKGSTKTLQKKIASYVINLGVSIDSQYEKDLTLLRDHVSETALEEEARLALIASREKSLEAHAIGEYSDDYTQKDSTRVIVPGLIQNLADGNFRLFGYVVSQKIHQEGIEKPTNSRPLTIAKNNLERTLNLPSRKCRSFLLTPEQMESLAVSGEVITL